MGTDGRVFHCFLTQTLPTNVLTEMRCSGVCIFAATGSSHHKIIHIVDKKDSFLYMPKSAP